MSQEGYKSIFKATSLFGGVQVITIIIGILKSKLAAVWLGPAGFGIMSLFSSVIQLISSVSNLGLASSAVRDISRVNGQGDQIQLAHIIKAISRWVLFTGLLGALITIVLSPLLSEWTFETDKYVLSFILLSIVVLFTAIFNGHYAILQGIRLLSSMAKARIFGSFFSALCSLPLFYFFRCDGIIPSLILTAFISCLASFYFTRRIIIPPIQQKIRASFQLGLSTIKLGVMMSMSAIAVSLVEFIVKSYIIRTGGVSDVGLYQAGWTLNATYLGLVFTAMATDYFPRLSQHAEDKTKVNEQINQQAEIAVLILGPMIICMLVFLPLLIRLLYTDKFLEIIPMTRWLLIGSLLKAGSWAISFVFLAKGNGKVFLINELGIKFITLPSYLIGYTLFGLEGIGFAFTFNYFVYFIWIAFIANKIYQFAYVMTFWKLFFIQFIFSMVYGLICTFYDNQMVYAIGGFILIMVSIHSFRELNLRLDVISYVNKFRKK